MAPDPLQSYNTWLTNPQLQQPSQPWYSFVPQQQWMPPHQQPKLSENNLPPCPQLPAQPTANPNNKVAQPTYVAE